MNFVMLNPEKIWQENLTGWSTSPIRCRYFSLGNPRSHYNSIIHIYFWLFMLSQKKTNYNPLAHPTWKCHHTNWWIAKLFHLTEGLLRSFKRWKLWKSHLWVVISGSEKNQLWYVATGMSGKQCQKLFRVTTFCISTCFQSFSTLISRVVHHAALKFSPCRKKLLPQALTYVCQYTCSSCSMP